MICSERGDGSTHIVFDLHVGLGQEKEPNHFNMVVFNSTVKWCVTKLWKNYTHYHIVYQVCIHGYSGLHLQGVGRARGNSPPTPIPLRIATIHIHSIES